MIPKDEREKDKAICARATEGQWAVQRGDEEAGDITYDIVRGHLTIAFVPEGSRDAHDRSDARADATAIVNAVTRLPKYIEAIDAIDARLAKLNRLIADATPRTPQAQAYVDGLVFARRVLRGET